MLAYSILNLLIPVKKILTVNNSFFSYFNHFFYKLILSIVVNSFFFFFCFMPLPRPSKICSKNSCSNNINVSQITSNEKISKFYLSKANTGTFDADYLNSTFDHKFVHLLNNDSELDIDSSLTLNQRR